jgi:hypothetical protein
MLVLCPASGWIRACVCVRAMIPRVDSEGGGVHCAFLGTETHTSHVLQRGCGLGDSTKLVHGILPETRDFV